MLTRREMLKRTVQGSSLLALSSTVPGFIASSARAAEAGKDGILVVVELGGGNDGLNTVIPYGDDQYHKYRPTLAFKENQVIRVDDHVGLHPALRRMEGLLENDQLAILQGVGYPNPNRSHFESMDVWQSADPRRRMTNGWLGRSLASLTVNEGGIPAFYVGAGNLPLAMQGSTTVPSLHPEKPFELQLSGQSGLNDSNDFAIDKPVSGDAAIDDTKSARDPDAARRKLIRELAGLGNDDVGAMQFVRRTSLQTYTTIERLTKIMGNFNRPQGEFARRDGGFRMVQEGLEYELKLVSSMIRAGFGTRIYYVGMDGFDTHSGQGPEHQALLETVAAAIAGFFEELNQSGEASRVLLMTFSEFGRRVRENGSKGTDHGSGSCMFVAGPAAKGGLVGKHPGLEPADLASGDLKFHTDFRQVYATLLDKWLGVDSRRVLGGAFEHLALLKQPA